MTAPAFDDRLDRVVQRIDVLEREVREVRDLVQKVAKQFEPTLDEHDDRLDAVESRVDTLALAVTDVKAEQRRLAAEMTRLANQQEKVVELLLAQGKQLDLSQSAQHAQAVVLQQQGESLEVLVRNTSQTLALLGGPR